MSRAAVLFGTISICRGQGAKTIYKLYYCLVDDNSAGFSSSLLIPTPEWRSCKSPKIYHVHWALQCRQRGEWHLCHSATQVKWSYPWKWASSSDETDVCRNVEHALLEAQQGSRCIGFKESGGQVPAIRFYDDSSSSSCKSLKAKWCRCRVLFACSRLVTHR